MAGLFDTLNIGTSALSTYRKAIDTAGHNLANVNTEGYTRQRLEIQSTTTTGEIGMVGAGSEAVRVVSLQNKFINSQIQVETSVQGALEVKQDALQQSINSLNETLDRNSASGTVTGGISQRLSDFFTSLQNVATTPASIPQRQNVLEQASNLAQQFRTTDSRLAGVTDGLNEHIQSDVTGANALLQEIADLNKKISVNESFGDSAANDLRDTRQQKLVDLSKLVKIDTAENENGAVSITVGGRSLVDGPNVVANLETFDDGSGNLQVRAQGDATALSLTGGSIQGAISARDNEVAGLRQQINELASTLITQVNQLHSTGFGMDGSTGLNLFNGTNAGDIQVNPNLDPSQLAVSGSSTETGDNSNILKISKLSTTAMASLNGMTFAGRQAEIVSGLGQQLASANTDLSDQQTIQKFLGAQRDSISGVSIDEEMANLILFQNAFQASAKLISMTDEMLNTIIQM
jgi:flagellar hook-associated protein 1 FlgK